MKVRSIRITIRRRKPRTLDLFEEAARDSGMICGIDEAGCGPLAGPVVAAAVILDPKRRIYGLRDSKVLKPERREQLAKRIRERAIAWAVAEASVEEIDSINILQARLLAMCRAVEMLGVTPEFAIVDGNRMPRLPFPGRAIIDGDALEPAISAASILAKTVRDSMMRRFDTIYPGYGFAQHMGYATPEHCERLNTLGPCILHRKSFAPVRLLAEGGAVVEFDANFVD